MATLFEITDEFQRFYQMAIDEELDDQAFADTLESILTELGDKSAGYVSVINQLEMEEAAAAKAEENFRRKKEIRRNRIKRMKDAVRDAMLVTDQKEIQAGDFVILLKKNGGIEPVIIDKPEDVPANMQIIKYENDNKRIREYLKEHKVDWAHLGERGSHIEIK